ncbi:MAG: hypothetical protein JSS36_06855 [Proteobacteria bacterium]|nr:hypothetical protein [Pseudomonadota bacterium]
MSDEHVKSYAITPGEIIQLESLPPEEKDAALGRYMDAFGRLESMIHIAIGEIVQIDLAVLGSFFAVLQTKQSIDLLDSIAFEHLSDEGADRVTKLCERLARRNMRRNRIVHGAWTQIVILNDKVATQQWVRSYRHINPRIRNLRYTDSSSSGEYTFTIDQLNNATEHVNKAIQDLSNLIMDLPSLRRVAE